CRCCCPRLLIRHCGRRLLRSRNIFRERLLVLRQIDRAGREVHDKGDYARNKKQDQAQPIERRDFPVDTTPVRPPAPLGIKERSTSARAASDSPLYSPTRRPTQELSSDHHSPGNPTSKELFARQVRITHNWYRPLPTRRAGSSFQNPPR